MQFQDRDLTRFNQDYLGVERMNGMPDHHNDRGGSHVFIGDLVQGGGVDVFVWSGCFADGYAWGFWRDAGGDEVVGEGAEVAAGHVDDQRCVLGEGSGPFGRDFELASGVMRGCEDEF